MSYQLEHQEKQDNNEPALALRPSQEKRSPPASMQPTNDLGAHLRTLLQPDTYNSLPADLKGQGLDDATVIAALHARVLEADQRLKEVEQKAKEVEQKAKEVEQKIDELTDIGGKYISAMQAVIDAAKAYYPAEDKMLQARRNAERSLDLMWEAISEYQDDDEEWENVVAVRDRVFATHGKAVEAWKVVQAVYIKALEEDRELEARYYTSKAKMEMLVEEMAMSGS